MFKKALNENKSSLRRKMILPTISLIISAIMLASSVTVAWLSINDKVESNGMKMDADVSPNLIIGTTAAAVTSETLARYDTTEVTFNTGRENMKAATHDWTVGTATGLKYCTNPSQVSSENGVKKGETDLTYGAVTAAADSLYYVDFTVYIASADADLTCTSLSASISTGTTLSETLKAASVDFYVGSVSSGNYKGTLNLAGLDIDDNREPDGTYDSTATKTSVDLITPTSPATTITIANATPTTVIMRCYFDGALLQSATRTYINSKQIVTTQFSLAVSFTANGAA